MGEISDEMMDRYFGREDWDEVADNATDAECCRCGDFRLCILDQDPYLVEIHPEDADEMEVDWWCYECWHNRKDDV